MGSCNRLTWGFLPSADPRGRACRRDRESAARKEPLLGGKKPTLPAGQPSGTDPQTFRAPGPVQLARPSAGMPMCPCVHGHESRTYHATTLKQNRASTAPDPLGGAWMPALLVLLQHPAPAV